MNVENDRAEPEPESLRVQLGELNERARVYTARQWQVPFAYLGVTGVILASLVDQETTTTFPIALIVAGILGILVYWHMLGNRDGAKRAVGHIQAVESQLNLLVTAEYRGNKALLPLELMTIVTVLAYFGGAVFLLIS